MEVSPPPYISDFGQLDYFRNAFQDAIIFALDVENVDYLRSERSHLSKLSELGYAWLDFRTINRNDRSPRTLAKSIQVRHGYVNKWAWVTEDTCLHKNLRTGTWVHTAQPYESQFSDSHRFYSPQDLANRAIETISSMSFRNRTEQEIKDKVERKVMVLFWASALEEKTLVEGGWSKRKHQRPDTHMFHFQKWSPVKDRWRKLGKSSAPCAEVMRSLGVNGINFHNAANDAYAEVLGMARFLTMNRDEYNVWTGGEHFPPIDMSWLDKSIVLRNKEAGAEEY